MNKINIYELMTWHRKNQRIFPYGLSIIPCILSALLVALPSIALLVSLIHKEKYEWIGFIIVCNISVHFFMTKCVRTNPGIIPQIVPHRETDQQLLQIPASKIYDQQRRYLLPMQNLNLHQKYCYQCRIFRPARTVHCGDCNHCVQKYDHHCPWLSVCIGKFNYIYFLGYICSLTVLSLYSVAICLNIVIKEVEAENNISQFIIQLLVLCLSFLFAIPMLRLSIYHSAIIYQKRTTNEDLKKIYNKEIKLPFTSCYLLKRNSFFNRNTQYVMDKRHKNLSEREMKSVRESGKMKQNVLGSINRQLNDSTTSSSNVNQGKFLLYQIKPIGIQLQRPKEQVFLTIYLIINERNKKQINIKTNPISHSSEFLHTHYCLQLISQMINTNLQCKLFLFIFKQSHSTDGEYKNVDTPSTCRFLCIFSNCSWFILLQSVE